jgi:hypothetical protein
MVCTCRKKILVRFRGFSIRGRVRVAPLRLEIVHACCHCRLDDVNEGCSCEDNGDELVPAVP